MCCFFACLQEECIQKHEKWTRTETESANVGTVQSDLRTEVCRRADWYLIFDLLFCTMLFFSISQSINIRLLWHDKTQATKSIKSKNLG